MKNKILTLTLLIFLLSGCGARRAVQDIIKENSRLADLPETAEILFLSNQDTKNEERPYRKEIYSMDGNGENVTRITFTEDHHAIMAMDKTRRYILSTRFDRDTKNPKGIGDEDIKNIWLLDLETKEERRLAPSENISEGDSFSPDGQWIVFFIAEDEKSQADIYKIKIDGSSLTNLTNTPYETEGDPAWSNKGDKIAYVGYIPKEKRFALKIMDSDGSNRRILYDNTNEKAKGNFIFPPGAYDPSWSPDDKWIVFESFMEHNNENGQAGILHIFKIRPDGTGLVDLSKAGGHIDRAEYLPSFSPDGESIIFTARYGPEDLSQLKINIFTMDKNGRNLKDLTNNNNFKEFAVWIQ